MIKNIFSALFIVFTFLTASAQDQISWKTSFEPTELKIGETATLVLEATLKDEWHIYGTENKCGEFGPLNTELALSSLKGIEPQGKLKAIDPHFHFSKDFECEVVEYENTAIFKIPVKVTSENISAKGTIDYMVCKSEFGCMPGDHVFNINQTAKKITETGGTIILDPEPGNGEKGKTPPTPPVKEVEKPETTTSTVDTKCDICDKVDSLNALVQQLTVANNEEAASFEGCDMERKAGWDDIVIERHLATEKESNWTDILWLILGAFLAGIITVFTPCVFPMLPMTVSFFTKSNSSKKGAVSQALMYGFSIVLIYTSVGVIVGKTIGPEFANWLAVNWVVNLVFFLIFVVFALSFMGMFEITLPSKWVNNIDSKADKGGIIGTFFMAFALVLVSFSCTGPIVGSIIVLAAQGNWLIPTFTMLSFSIAFALPFTITALFPSLMNKLPKSGGWLNSIKVVLGLAELALALKFLSQIDQVENLGILDREVFITIWIGVFITIALYLFGKIKFPHDSPLEKISVPRSLLAIGSLCFAIYLLPGLWGAPLKSFSGIFPPMHTQDFVLGVEKDNGEYLCEDPIYGDKLHVAHDIKGYFDLRQAICCAKAQKKPLFIDFTGKSCTNCRLMESKVWSDPKVLETLKKEFVVVSLYADEYKIKLPIEEQYVSESGREITSLGKSVQEFQREKYGLASTLPTYSIVGYDEINSTDKKIILKELAETRAFDTDIQDYLGFMNTGIENYKGLNVAHDKK